MPIRIGSCLMAFMVASAAMPSPTRAADAVKVAIGQIDAWANQAPTLVPPADRTVREGDHVRIALSAGDPEGESDAVRALDPETWEAEGKQLETQGGSPLGRKPSVRAWHEFEADAAEWTGRRSGGP